jgi:hypothetical protein
MRIVLGIILAIAGNSSNAIAVPLPASVSSCSEPTAEQIAEAKKRFGAGYGARADTDLRRTIHLFRFLPGHADLRNVRDLPFCFGLDLINCTEITDDDLKQLKGLENLTDLYLMGTGVTDIGLSEKAKGDIVNYALPKKRHCVL